MAISKILSIGDCGKGHRGRHLREALDYIANQEKTGEGKWIGSINCQKENAYAQMLQTKKTFDKTDKRQGYHMIISFVEGEMDADTAFEIIGRFTKEYLGKGYEALYTVHDNTEHIHGHVIFNSVSFLDGKKYRYNKGDWAKKIQPITNHLCEEYGLSTIEIGEDSVKPTEHYKEWNDFRDGKYVWADMIKRDLDSCILQAPTYESFLMILTDRGYEIKNAYRSEGKHLAIKPKGMTRFRRCKSLGDSYNEEMIRERILTENLSIYQQIAKKEMPQIIRCRVKRYRRAKLSGIQKKYFAKLYHTGQLKKRPYSQAWKYRDDIRKMQKLQEDYLFLSRHDISTVADIAMATESVSGKKRETAKGKSKLFKERARMKPLFDAMAEMQNLQECENCYQRGEVLFEEEHLRWQDLHGKIEKEGYTEESLILMKEHYQSEIAHIREKEKAVAKEERIAKRVLREHFAMDEGRGGTRQYFSKDKDLEDDKNQDKKRQPR